MELYEAHYKDGFEWKFRVFDDQLNRSKSLHVSSLYEYFVKDQYGEFTAVSDSDVKLSRRLGSYKDAINNYGMFNPHDKYIRDNFQNRAYNMNPRVWYLDIETRVTRGEFPTPSKAQEEISLIQIFDNKSRTMLVLGRRPYKPQKDYELEYPVRYIQCSSELELLRNYITVFKKLDPLIIYAWNGDNFDYPYMFNRFSNVGLDPNSMSNYGACSLKSDTDEKKRVTFNLVTPGHYYLDLMKVYKKFTFEPMPSYSLNFISSKELNDVKVQHDEFGDFDSFYTGENYIISKVPYDDRVREEIRQLKIKERKGESFDHTRLEELLNFQFVYYGIKDVYLLKKIDDKRNFTNIIVAVASEMGCSLGDTLGTIRPWERGLKNIYYSRRMVCEPKKDVEEDPWIVGGFVRDPVVGVHKYLTNVDVNSMYPMLSIKGFNMSPETFVPFDKLPPELSEHISKLFNSQDESKVLMYDDSINCETARLLKKYDYAMSPRGVCYSREFIGVVPDTVAKIYFGRKADKKKMLEYECRSEAIREILDKRGE